MPFANIKVIDGVFPPDEKQQIIQKVTEALVSGEGENLREAMGGKSLSTDAVNELQSQ